LREVAILRQPEWPKVSVSVRYFAGAQAAAGVAEEQLTLSSPPASPLTVRDLVSELVARHGPNLARVLAASSFIVDEVTAGPERPLDDGAQVDVLPPFAGG
jgi:molybdopterin synthase sulfur carrier subunit